jgi:hypothetical protein
LLDKGAFAVKNSALSASTKVRLSTLISNYHVLPNNAMALPQFAPEAETILKREMDGYPGSNCQAALHCSWMN